MKGRRPLNRKPTPRRPQSPIVPPQANIFRGAHVHSSFYRGLTIPYAIRIMPCTGHSTVGALPRFTPADVFGVVTSFMQSRATGLAALDEAAEAAPTVTADRKAPQIALSAMNFKATIIIISSRGSWRACECFDDRPPCFEGRRL